MIGEKLRTKIITALKQNKKNLQEIKNGMGNIEGSDETRKNLLQAEFSIIEAIHQTRLIKSSDKKEEEKKETNQIESESSEK